MKFNVYELISTGIAVIEEENAVTKKELNHRRNKYLQSDSVDSASDIHEQNIHDFFVCCPYCPV